tara:strand:- start:27131 stop:28024 length:894 start_codon:yes stop_codon:yes gene_type:complete
LSKQRVIIFGVSAYGRSIYRILRDDKAYEIVAFIDNDPQKQGDMFDGKEIFNPSNINQLRYDQIYIGGRHIDEQVAQIVKIGVDPESIKLIKKPDLKLTSEERKIKNYEIDSVLQDLIPILEENNISYWLDYSSLLSLYRKDDLAEFSDIDIALNSHDSGIELWNHLQSSRLNDTHQLKMVTFDADTEISLKGNVLKIEIQSNGNPWDEHAIFDIHVKYPHGDSYKHFIENNTHFCPKDFLDNHEYYQYKNFNLRVPSRVNDYLSLIYGDKWIVPADYWSGSSYGNILKSDISSSGN